jgi:hypothetical protein
MPASPIAIRSFLILLALTRATTVMAKEPVSPLTKGPVANVASPGCPAEPFSGTLPASPSALRAELLQLNHWLEACDTRADFHAHRGALLLTAGWPLEAATALEKALLLNPELPGAQLDYAQALAQQGQRTPAIELVRQVAQRPDIQPDLKQWLSEGFSTPTAMAGRPPLPTADWLWSGLVQSSLGHETNLASATHTTSLTLNLIGGPVEVPLADSERPRAGTALKTMAAVQGVRVWGDGEVRLNAALQSRHAQAHAAPDNQLAEAAAAYARPWGPGTLQGSVGAHAFSQRGVYQYSDHAYSLKYEPFWHLGACKNALSVGRTEQRYASSPTLDGHYQHLRLEAACNPHETPTGTGQAATLLGLSSGKDTPLNANRPGGIKNRLEVYARHEQSTHLPLWASPGLLTIWYRFSNSQDTEVFSSLLGQNTTQTKRHDGGVGYWLPLRSGWSWGIDVESTSQKSTNTLLNIRNFSIYGGLRWTSP